MGASPRQPAQTSLCGLVINDLCEDFDQSKYVPWLVCMDSNGDPTEQCDSQVGISDSDVQTCLADNSALIAKYLQIDSPIGGTPTVYVNGKNVKTSYSAISKALCN